jgi:hypothetical protein
MANGSLRDVRPYLYAMGYWYDEMIHEVPAWQRHAAEGDAAIETLYVQAGREVLRVEQAKGHGLVPTSLHDFISGKLIRQVFHGRPRLGEIQ